MAIQVLECLPPDITVISPRNATSVIYNVADGNLAITRYYQPNCLIDISPSIIAIDSTNIRIAASLKGDVYIAQNKIYFTSPSQTLSIDYENMTVHAISRCGDRTIERPHIYCQLDENISSNIIDKDGTEVKTKTILSTSDDDEEEGSDDEQMKDEVTYELRIVPDDASSLDSLFQTMSECASLHPDPHMDEDEAQQQTFPDHNNPNGEWVFASDEQQQENPGPERHYNLTTRYAPYHTQNHHHNSNNHSGGSAEHEEMMRAAMQHIQDRFDVPHGYAEDMITQTLNTGSESLIQVGDFEGQFQDVDDDIQS